LGLVFVAAFLLSVVKAIGIYRIQPLWGWSLSVLIAFGSLLGYLLSRTVGLPVSGVEAWGPFIGYLFLVVEVFFIGLFIFKPEFKQLVSNVKRS
jgi:hypothetical protein